MKCTICKIYKAKAWLKRKPVCNKCYKIHKTSKVNRHLMKLAWYVRRRLSEEYNG